MQSALEVVEPSSLPRCTALGLIELDKSAEREGVWGATRWVKPFQFIHNHNLEKLPNSAPLYRAQYFVPNAGECGISGTTVGMLEG